MTKHFQIPNYSDRMIIMGKKMIISETCVIIFIVGNYVMAVGGWLMYIMRT